MPGKSKQLGDQKKRAEKRETKAKDEPAPGPSKQKKKETVATKSDSGSQSEDSEDDGVDENGMAKLLELLGDDGLDEYGQMQLDLLAGGEDDDESDDGIGGSGEGSGEEQESNADNGDEEGPTLDDESDSSSDDGQESNPENGENATAEVALEEAESVDEDAVPRQKILINNKYALERICETIKLDSKLPWTETLAVTYPEAIDVDVEDDLNRELAFYKQALHGAKEARKLADRHKLPFTRPPDYFAEMVKSDVHMERVRQRLLDENSQIKKSEDKRKEREGKKFGKQVQVEKQKERERNKKEMEERLKGLKRKRKDMLDKPEGGDDDGFDVAVEDAIAERPKKRSKDGGSKISRTGRDAKFGFGGGNRRSKQNTRESTEKFDFGDRRGAGGHAGKGARGGKSKRLGKGRRQATRGR